MVLPQAKAAGPLHHFSFGAIANPQQVSNSFSASLTARDAAGGLITDWNGSVTVSGLSPKNPTVLITEIDTGATDKIELSNLRQTDLDIGGWQAYIYDSASYPAPKVTFTFPAGTICPGRTPFQLRSGGTSTGSFPTFFLGTSLTWSTSSGAAVLLRDANGNIIDFFSASSLYSVAITNPTTIPVAEWTGLSVTLNSDTTKTYQRIGFKDHNSSIDWLALSNNVGTINPTLQLPFSGGTTNVALFPTTVTLTNGQWSGSFTISNAVGSMFLRADNLSGVTGDTSSFAVLDGLPLHLSVPSDAYEAQAGVVGNGNVTIDQPLATNLLVYLASSNPTEIGVPATVIISIGQTNASFAVTNFDDVLLDGTKSITMTATATGYAKTDATIQNHDDELASLQVILPATVQENAGTLSGVGQVVVAAPVAAHFFIALTSSRSDQLQVPSTVLLPAGATSATFNVTVTDDKIFNGSRSVTVSGSFPGWIAGQSQTIIVDNESTNIALVMPTAYTEGDGVLSNVATVKLAGIATANVVVNLSSDNPTKLQVPSSVVIPSGQTSVVFSVTIPEDTLTDGTQSAKVTASANGFFAATANCSIKDNDLHHFLFSSIANPQAIDKPFGVTAYASDINGITLTKYAGVATLAAVNPLGAVSMQGGGAIQFTNGIWSGTVAFNSETPAITLVCDDANGRKGVSNPFDIWGRVVTLPTSDIVYDTVSQRIFAGVGGNYGTDGQSVISVNPQTGLLGTPIFIQNEPGRLALSDNGQYLYVGLNTTGGVARINTSSNGIDLRFSLGQEGYYGWGPFFAESMKVIPGNPLALAVSLRVNFGSYNQGTAVYDGAIMRSNAVGSMTSSSSEQLEVTGVPNLLYAMTSRSARKMNVTASGLSVASFVSGELYDGQVKFANGRLYCSNGNIFSTNNFEVLGTFPVSGLVQPVAAENRVYYVTSDGTGWLVRVFDMTTLADLGTRKLPSLTGTPSQLLYCGSNTLACGTSAELVLFHTATIPVANIGVTQLITPNPASSLSNITYAITVTNYGHNNAEGVVVTNNLVSGLNFVSVSSSQGSSVFQNGAVVTSLGMLTNRGSAMILVVASPQGPGVGINTISANAFALDLNRTNNFLSAAVPILGSSNTNEFSFLTLPTRDLVYDPVTARIYASVPSGGGPIGNTITAINPETLSIESSYPIGDNPGKLSIADVGRYIYVGLDGESSVRCFDTLTGTAGTAFSIGAGFKVLDLEVLAGTTNLVAVSKYITGSSDFSGELYDNGVKRPNGASSVGFFAGSSDASKVYGGLLSQYVQGTDELVVTPSGLTITNHYASIGGDMQFSDGLLYAGNGIVLDTQTAQYAQPYAVMLYDGIVRPAPTLSRVYFLTDDPTWYFQENDLNSRALLKFKAIPGMSGSPTSFILWGTNGLAFRTSGNQVYIFHPENVSPLSTAELSIAQSASSLVGTVGSNSTYTLIVSNAGPDTATGVVVSDTLPRDSVFVSASSSAGTVTNVGNVVTFTVGTLTNTALFTANIVVQPGMAGLATNAVSVAATQNDYNPSNNSSVLLTTNLFLNDTSLLGQISIPASDIIYDPVANLIYAATAGGTGAFSNAIVAVNPVTGEITKPLSLGAASGTQLAISDNAQYLYIALSTGGVARVDITNWIEDLRFTVDSTGNATSVADLEVMPGNPHSLAVSRNNFGGNEAVLIFDDGVPRPNMVGAAEYGGTYFIEFSSATNLYSTYIQHLRTIAVDATGLHLVSQANAPVAGYSPAFKYDSGQAIFLSGSAVDPVTLSTIGTYPVGGLVAPDIAHQRTYFLTQAGNALLSLRAFNSTTFSQTWSTNLPAGLGSGLQLRLMGTNGVMCLTDAGRILMARTSHPSLSQADLSVIASANVTSASIGATMTYTCVVLNNGRSTASGVSFTNVLPPGMLFQSGSCSQGTFSQTNGIVSCSLGTILNAGSATVTISVKPQTLGLITNTVSVTSNGADPVMTNNVASVVTTVISASTLSIVDTAVREGNSAGSILFNVTLLPPSSQTVTVQYKYSNSTAIGGVDFSTNVGVSGTLNFTPGATNRTIFLSGNLLGNNIVQSNRYFFMNLTNATNAVIARSQGVCWIVEDDFIQFGVSNTTALEGNSGITSLDFNLILSPSNSQPVSVSYETFSGTASAGSDYTPKGGVLYFPAGVTNKVVPIALFGDSLIEADETIGLTLFDPVGAILLTNSVTGTILNDDAIKALAVKSADFHTNSITLWFDTIEGRIYRIEKSYSLAPASWSGLGDVIGSGATAGISDTVETNAPAAFYRLNLLP